MLVKAKFICNCVTNYQYNQQVEMSAVYGTEGENKDFSKATPSGKLNICIDKETPAFDSFIPGKSYYLTFEEAE